MRNQLTPIVTYLLVANVVIFFAGQLGLQPLFNQYLAAYSFLSPYFNPAQLFTYMFLHAGFMHLFSNMLGLFFFGPMLEQVWGGKRFAFFYFFCGVGAMLIQQGINYYEISKVKQDAAIYLQNPNPGDYTAFVNKYRPDIYVNDEFYNFSNQFEENPGDPQLIASTKKDVETIFQQKANNPTVGASGAIFGILMAFGLLFPNTEILLYFLFPIKAKYFVILYGLFELYSGVKANPGDNVAHFAHLGGMLFALILIWYWRGQRNRFY
ncbi:MAG: rhomboid family intramembrane serine protease [Verrucomicrobia bacterium]|nr:rhomboid family intramembrane serine protease [Cytophagales bacterium]